MTSQGTGSTSTWWPYQAEDTEERLPVRESRRLPIMLPAAKSIPCHQSAPKKGRSTVSVFVAAE